jgi:glycosyltransferase involved in cell wall biosynthesis
VPVVAARVGGLPDVVLQGETGYLRPVGDTAGMAEDVARLLGDPALRERMGQAGVDRASQLFSLDKALAQHEALYASLVDGGS